MTYESGSLGEAGGQLWDFVTSSYELAPAEAELLNQACQVTDTISDLEAALAEQPLVVCGSMGQPRTNPLLREIAEQRRLLTSILAQLGLPPPPGRENEEEQARWRHTRGFRDG